jgi:anti-sigma factor RsiW
MGHVELTAGADGGGGGGGGAEGVPRCSPALTQRAAALRDRALSRLSPQTRRLVLHYGELAGSQLAAMLPLTLLQASSGHRHGRGRAVLAGWT